MIVLTGALWVRQGLSLSRWQKSLLWCLIAPLAFWIATYRPEGFSYPLVFGLVGDSGAMPRYEFFANLGKGICGFLLLYFLWSKRHDDEFTAAPKHQFLMALLAPTAVIGLAIPVLELHLQPKGIEKIALFALGNLLIICVAEEAFMRLLLQQSLRNAIAVVTDNRWVQELVPLVVVTAIFVAIHSGLSGAAIWVYALAGFLYGLSYTLSKNIFYPIMIHFFVNQIHFSFLTYPLG
ncbi:MAG: CAAX protease [Cellvibrio sp. 79]|nr:MAG: CAAX protease [Cellvibrio sp. 79]